MKGFLITRDLLKIFQKDCNFNQEEKKMNVLEIKCWKCHKIMETVLILCQKIMILLNILMILFLKI